MQIKIHQNENIPASFLFLPVYQRLDNTVFFLDNTNLAQRFITLTEKASLKTVCVHMCHQDVDGGITQNVNVC